MPMKVETMNQRVPLLLQEIDGNKISEQGYYQSEHF